MKIDFTNLNVEPMPNPKPLTVERVSVSMDKSEAAAPAGKTSPYGYIRNVSIHPSAHTGRG
jgi:hypothetical protein